MTFATFRDRLNEVRTSAEGPPVGFARPGDVRAAAGIRAAAFAEAEAVSRLSMRLFQDRWRAAAAGLSALLECRTPQDVLAVQAALVCEDLDLVRGGCERLSDIIARAAGDTVRSLPEAV